MNTKIKFVEIPERLLQCEPLTEYQRPAKGNIGSLIASYERHLIEVEQAHQICIDNASNAREFQEKTINK